MSHISNVLNFQAHARRNALQATREIRVLRHDRVEATQALRMAAVVSPDAPPDESQAGSACPPQKLSATPTMRWNRDSLSVVCIHETSTIPEQREGDRLPHWPGPEAFNLIEIIRVGGGLWKAVCECGEAPDLFTQQAAAWEWVTHHRCPVLHPLYNPLDHPS